MCDHVQIGNTRLDVEAQRVYVHDTDVRLSPQEYLIFEYVITRRKRAWTTSDLKMHLFENTYFGAKPVPQSRGWLPVQLINIRQKIGKAGSSVLIKGHPSVGGYTVYISEGIPH